MQKSGFVIIINVYNRGSQQGLIFYILQIDELKYCWRICRLNVEVDKEARLVAGER